jgi:diadenylate cyclase
MVLYSVEIKRIIWAKKSARMTDVKHGELSYDEEKVQECITEIIKALQNMSKNDVGAIIVLSTGNVPPQILDSGVRLDSDISSELIESVFFPKTPLHDGAMIINGTKIVSAGCFLPLSQNVDNIPKDLGTRHRAGIGVTETIDVMSFIVSEETGIISVARAGKITRYADTEILKRTLGRYYWQELESARK